MMECGKVTIGKPDNGKVYIDAPLCGGGGEDAGEQAKQHLIRFLTADIYQITGSLKDVALNVYMVGGDPIFVASQDNEGLFAYMTPPEMFYAAVSDGKFTGDSGFTGMSGAIDSFITDYSVHLIHPTDTDVAGMQMYLSQMGGVAVNVVVV